MNLFTLLKAKKNIDHEMDDESVVEIPKGWANISVVDALELMGEKPVFVDTEEKVVDFGAKVKAELGYSGILEDIDRKKHQGEAAEYKFKMEHALAQKLHDNRIQVFDNDAVMKYKQQMAKKTGHHWNNTEIQKYRGEIPRAILEFCLDVKSKIGTQLHVDFLADKSYSLDPFIFVVSGYYYFQRFYIAVWDEPKFDSKKHLIPALRAMKP